MRIAIWHNLPSGGGKRALFDQVRGLLRHGHTVEVWCPPTADQTFLPLRDVVTEHVVPIADAPNAPPGRFRRRVHDAKIIGFRMALMEEHCRRCADEMAARDFNLVFAHPCRSFRASPIALFTQLPSVLYLQEPFRELYEASPDLPWSAPWREFKSASPAFWKFFLGDSMQLAGKRVQVREEKRWIAAFDQVLVNSQFSRESVMRSFNVDARVCYLGVDVQAFSPPSIPKRPYVVGLGNLHFNKRPEFAVECIAAMAKPNRPQLVWIGNFGDVDGLSRFAAAREVDLEVRIMVPHDELRTLLGGAAAMLYTSHLEPFGYAPLEANACGTAVVAIAEGGVRESVGNPACGVLIPNLDPVAFANALRPFCDDLDFATQFGRGARRYVEDAWSADAATVTLGRELRRVVARGRAPGQSGR